MLKKAGIVVAAAAAGLLAVSPLAFAGDKGDHGHEGHYAGEKNVNAVGGDQSEGLINVADNNFAIPINVCDNQVPIALVQVPLNDTVATLTGALGILGSAEAESEVTNDDDCTATASNEDVSQSIDD